MSEKDLLRRIEAAKAEVAAMRRQALNAYRAQLADALVCVECGTGSTDRALGWQAHRVDLEEIAFYCPGCAGREFGG